MKLGCDGITGSVECWPCISVKYHIHPHLSGQGKMALGAVERQIPYRSLYNFIIRAWPFFTSLSVSSSCNLQQCEIIFCGTTYSLDVWVSVLL